jgi:hypothetical protein
MRDACVLILVAWFSTMGYLTGSGYGLFGTEDPPFWASILIGISAIPVIVAWGTLVADLPSDHSGDRADKPHPEGRGGVMDLLARLGNFIYWIGSVLAFLLFVGGIWAYAAAFPENKGVSLVMCWVGAAISSASAQRSVMYSREVVEREGFP